MTTSKFGEVGRAAGNVWAPCDLLFNDEDK